MTTFSYDSAMGTGGSSGPVTGAVFGSPSSTNNVHKKNASAELVNSFFADVPGVGGLVSTHLTVQGAQYFSTSTAPLVGEYVSCRSGTEYYLAVPSSAETFGFHYGAAQQQTISNTGIGSGGSHAPLGNFHAFSATAIHFLATYGTGLNAQFGADVTGRAEVRSTANSLRLVHDTATSNFVDLAISSGGGATINANGLYLATTGDFEAAGDFYANKAYRFLGTNAVVAGTAMITRPASNNIAINVPSGSTVALGVNGVSNAIVSSASLSSTVPLILTGTLAITAASVGVFQPSASQLALNVPTGGSHIKAINGVTQVTISATSVNSILPVVVTGTNAVVAATSGIYKVSATSTVLNSAGASGTLSLACNGVNALTAASSLITLGVASATPLAYSIRGAAGLGTNIAGAGVNVDAGPGTGLGNSGTGNLRASVVGVSGAVLQSTYTNLFSWTRGAIGFFGVTPASRAAAYTQTFSTASRIVPAVLTDSTTGTPGTTLVDAGAVFSQAALNNNFASLNARMNTLWEVVNSIIDDQQTYGLAQ